MFAPPPNRKGIHKLIVILNQINESPSLSEGKGQGWVFLIDNFVYSKGYNLYKTSCISRSDLPKASLREKSSLVNWILNVGGDLDLIN
jgi:hypothetical protein